MPFLYRTTRRAGSVASAAERAGAACRRAEGPWAFSISTAASSEQTTTMNRRMATSVRQAWRALSIRHRRLDAGLAAQLFCAFQPPSSKFREIREACLREFGERL